MCEKLVFFNYGGYFNASYILAQGQRVIVKENTEIGKLFLGKFTSNSERLNNAGVFSSSVSGGHRFSYNLFCGVSVGGVLYNALIAGRIKQPNRMIKS